MSINQSGICDVSFVELGDVMRYIVGLGTVASLSVIDVLAWMTSVVSVMEEKRSSMSGREAGNGRGVVPRVGDFVQWSMEI